VPVIIASIRDTGEVWAPKKRLVQKAVCKLATCVLANADAVRSQLIRDGYDERKLAVIRNGIDLPRLDRCEGTGPIRREFGIPEDSPVITVLSRLNDLKGIPYFPRCGARSSESLSQNQIPDCREGPARVGSRGPCSEQEPREIRDFYRTSSGCPGHPERGVHLGSAVAQ
jgi:hypothetical protein